MAQHRDDVAVTTLLARPLVVLVRRDRRETHLDAQFGTFEENLLHDVTRVVRVIDLHQETQRQGMVDIRLAHIQDGGAISTQNLRHGSSHTRTILSMYANQYNLTNH